MTWVGYVLSIVLPVVVTWVYWTWRMRRRLDPPPPKPVVPTLSPELTAEDRAWLRKQLAIAGMGEPEPVQFVEVQPGLYVPNPDHTAGEPREERREVQWQTQPAPLEARR